MEAAAIVALLNALVSGALQIWSSARKVYGEEAIPEWTEILLKNQELQDKINAERGGN